MHQQGLGGDGYWRKVKPLLVATVIGVAGFLGAALAMAQEGSAQSATVRKWTDASGQFQVEASLVRVAGDQVMLRRADGREITVQATILSEKDRAFLATVDTTSKGSQAPTGGTGSGEWPAFLGPSGTGVSTENGLTTTFPDSGPKEVWRVPLGTGYSGLAVAGGRLYTLYGSGGREHVAAFDTATGRELWKIDQDADFAEGRSHGPRATPRVEGATVYTAGASGLLSALKVADGSVIWSMNLYEKFGQRRHEEGYAPSPLVDDNRLIVMAGKSVYALDKASGAEIWRALDEKINHSTPRIAQVDGKRTLLVLTAQNLVGLNPETGEELWRAPQEAMNIATPVVGPENRIFAGAAYGYGCQVVEVGGGSARQVFQNDVLSCHVATPIFHEGHLYGFHDRIGLLRCVDFSTGSQVWETRGSGKGQMIAADGQMIILTESGKLVLAPFSTSGYAPTAEAQVLKGICYTAPALVGGRAFLRSDAEMVCVDLRK